MSETHLTPREKEIIEWLCAGKTTAQISEIIGITKATVEDHKHAVMDKFGAANSVAMVAAAFRQGLVN